MGVDIAFIIPTKLRSKRNHKECVRCLDATISQVERFFHGKKHFIYSRYVEKENEELLRQFSPTELELYSFTVPFLDNGTFDLFAGFWCVTNAYRHWHYFVKCKDTQGHWRSFLREIFFDAVRMIGGTEGWLCGDMSLDEFVDYKDDAFDAWVHSGEGESWGTVHDFDLAEAKDMKEDGFPDYWAKEHDTFKECFELLQEYQNRFPQYEILTIHSIGENILIADGDNIYLMNPHTGKRLTDFPIDGIRKYDFSGVTLYRGDEYAKFDFTGKQLTEFKIEIK